ncbi:MAG: peptidylprolyl isomerase [Bacteroidetes bacterium]|jgi:cyclophilin family peptidyl-prolyl cis-trans isomerase|nr:peptidylprolyl isomerase [Bacteroidota bacterium]
MKIKHIIGLIGWFFLAFGLISASGCNENGANGPRQVLIHTSFGDMVMELSDSTPGHRDNFVQLVETGFYDSLQFHRIIKDFMIQGGDPESKLASRSDRLGSGGPGYTVPQEIRSDHLHFKGALAAARQGDQANPKRASSGSQFYLVQGRSFSESELMGLQARVNQDRLTGKNDFGYEEGESFTYSPEAIARYSTEGGTPFLDNQYTVFGYVISGLNIVDSIAAVKTAAGDRPVAEERMTMEMIN